MTEEPAPEPSKRAFPPVLGIDVVPDTQSQRDEASQPASTQADPQPVADAQATPSLSARLVPTGMPGEPAPSPLPGTLMASKEASKVNPTPTAATMPPLLPPMPSAVPEAKPDRSPRDTAPIPAMLVVDDNADYRFVVVREMRRLRPQGLRIEEADGAQNALNLLPTLLRENQRVFLLTDFRMPNLTGLDLVTAAQRNHPGADLQYLIYSGINLRTAPELRSLGPDEFMEKPGDLIELRRQVGRILDRFLGPSAQLRAV